ncbi:hypothetical protein MKK67_10660 [Methylobacterium sp. J-072]|uniref:hypothetical protein n=1 Tax=Methylobacterium sp. J-072 TaxID=2836651 RepID=UPI001FBBD95C|nr:hypothetical protein [Methylobacterium sp. J-072]MCJ2092956.1 hypothetical protein [Methylobacterium sp. J-072]
MSVQKVDLILSLSKGFSSLECALLARRRFRLQAEIRIACFGYGDGFHNPLRRHSALGYRSPVADEQETRPGICYPSHRSAKPANVHQTGGLQLYRQPSPS